MTEHVCPVGALTTKDFRFKARVWFLRTAKSVCQGCATGCNAHLDYDPRYNKAYRYRPRDNEKVNKFWMCDEGCSPTRRRTTGASSRRCSGGGRVATPGAREAKKLFEGSRRTRVGVVFSARTRSRTTGRCASSARSLIGRRTSTGRAADGYEDDILIHRDKNPNTRGCQELAPARSRSRRSSTTSRAARHARHRARRRRRDPRRGLPRRSTLHARHDRRARGPAHRAAAVVLPRRRGPSSGTYVNAKGMRQIAEKALEPLGAQAGVEAARAAGDALGYEPSWTKLKQIRAQAHRRNAAPERLGRRPVSPRPRERGVSHDRSSDLWDVVKILVMVGFVLNLAAILTWADRRQSSMIQDRIGPNRAVIKIFGKEIRVAASCTRRPTG
jgi:NADH-quinone oxidoreductase subunit G